MGKVSAFLYLEIASVMATRKLSINNCDDRMKLSFAVATETDAVAIAALRNAAADDLTRLYSHGSWSSRVTEKGVLFARCRERALDGAFWMRLSP